MSKIKAEWFASSSRCPNTGLYCRVERDSISPDGKRLTTFVITFPRIILCEVNTHCALSKNTSSSRAIPYSRPFGTRRPGQPPTMREMVMENPYLPMFWGQNEKGMQASGELSPEKIKEARSKILSIRNMVVDECDKIWDIGLHKQDINRYLEPWAWTTQVITGTEWANFFALRTDRFAHPAFQLISRMMYLRMKQSVPALVNRGEWHLPFVDDEDRANWKIEDLKRISVSRTARVSYNTMDGVRDVSKDFELYDKLIASFPKHMCYDSDTEVLTSEGWKKWPNVIGNEYFATMGMNGVTEYQQATSTYLNKEYNGKMYSFKSRSMNLLVTPDHNIYCCPMTTIKGRKKENFKLLPAYMMMSIDHCHLKIGKLFEKNGSWTYEKLALLGFAMGDGWRDWNKLKFKLTKERKIKYLKSICPQIEELENNVYSIEYPFDFDLKVKGFKEIPQRIIMEENNQPLFEGLMNSDGSINESHILFNNTSERLVDQFCQICFHLGKAFNKTLGLTPDREAYWSVNVCEIEKPVPVQMEMIDYHGKIYCVTVPNGLLYVRRDGKGIWSGNSPTTHQGTPGGLHRSNFIGWDQLRKEIVGENITMFNPSEAELLEWGLTGNEWVD